MHVPRTLGVAIPSAVCRPSGIRRGSSAVAFHSGEIDGRGDTAGSIGDVDVESEFFIQEEEEPVLILLVEQIKAGPFSMTLRLEQLEIQGIG